MHLADKLSLIAAVIFLAVFASGQFFGMTIVELTQPACEVRDE